MFTEGTVSRFFFFVIPVFGEGIGERSDSPGMEWRVKHQFLGDIAGGLGNLCG